MYKVNLQCFTKVLSVVCGILIIYLAVTRFQNIDVTHFQTAILTFHFIWLGGVLVLAEFEVVYILDQFKLVRSYCGRGFYCIFLGTIMITNGDKLQLAIAVSLICVGILYFFVQAFAKRLGLTGNQNPYQIPNYQNGPNNYQGAQNGGQIQMSTLPPPPPPAIQGFNPKPAPVLK